MDRAINIRMRRRGPGEKVAPFRTRRDAVPLRAIRDRLHEWVRSSLKDLQAAVPDLPVEDRAADTWEPLFAIAEQACGEWPKHVRKARFAMAGEDPDDGRIGTQLLDDLKGSGAQTRITFSPERSSTGSKIEEAHGQSGGVTVSRSTSGNSPTLKAVPDQIDQCSYLGRAGQGVSPGRSDRRMASLRA
jgi:hypothetical protein